MAKRTWQKKLLRIVLKTVGVLFLLVIAIVILIQTPFVQNIVRKKAVTYLQEKLHTKVAIGKIYIGFPKDVVLKDIYIEDLQKDTLLWGGEISANVSMIKLLHNEIELNEVKLENMTAKIKRQLPDTTFNFQFIIDAFASKDTKAPVPDPKDTSSMKMAVKSVILDKVRFVYKDVVTGNDLESYVGHFDTKIDHFDLNKLQFDIPTVNLKGFRATFIQNSPLQTPAATIKQAKPDTDTTNMQLGLHAIELGDIAVTFQSNTSGFYTSFAAATLSTSVREFSMDKQTVELNKIQLEGSTIVARMDKQQARPPVSDTKAGKDTSEDTGGWRILASKTMLDNIQLQYDDENKPATKQGIDYAHIKASNFSLGADNLLYTKDSIAGTITKGSFKEQSGFELRRMQTAFLYTDKEAFLKDLVIETPGSSIKRSISIQYPSMDAIAKNPELIRMDADINNSRILLKDVLTFVPGLRSQPLFKNPQQTLFINTRMRGSLANLDIGTLQFTGLRDTKVDVAGNIQHATDSKRIHANLQIKNLSSSKRDLETLLPAGTLPSNITIPDRFALNGRLNGGPNNINTNLTFNSTLGSANIVATAQQFSDKLRAVYDATIDVRNLDVGTILQDTAENIGIVTARFHAKGKGYDPQYANAIFDGVVKSATLKKYTYNDFRVKGSIANRQAKATASIHDRNIALSLDASGNFATKYPSAQLTLNVDSIHTFPLHLTADTVVYKGSIVADFPSTNPDSLKGTLITSTSYFAKNNQVLPLDSIRLTAGQSDSGQFIRLDSRPIQANIAGTYKLTQMGAVFAQLVEPYFSTQEDSSKQAIEPYNFTVTASVKEDSLLKVFMPTLKKMDSITLRGNFSSNNGPTATLQAPSIIIGENQINNLQLTAVGKDSSLDINTSFNHLQVGTGIEINKTSLNARLANNKIDFILASQDKGGKDKYKLAGLFEQPAKGEYAFSLKQGDILLNYDDWTVSSDNKILIRKGDINVTNFVLSKSGQQLSIASTSTAVNAPVDVNFSNFKIGTLTGFIKPDSTLAAGTLNGKATLNDLMTQPTFTSDLTINTLVINKDTVGDVAVKVNNTVANTFAADVSITGKGNDIHLTGNYFVKPNNKSTFDLVADIRQLELKSMEGATNGFISKGSGSLNGKLAITGTLDDPSVIGDINFNKAAFNLKTLNSYFSVDQEKISFTDEGISFNTFTIKDSASNEAVIDGTARTDNFMNYKFDMTLRARNFHVLNTTKKDNKIYYGQLYFNTNLRLKGTEAQPVIDGSLTVNDGTKLTVVLPQREPGVVDRDGIVEFIDLDKPGQDSLLLATYDSLNQSQLAGMDVSVNVEIAKEAEFSLVIDQTTGDFLNMKGEALLNGGIDPSGKVTLTGSYEIDEGAYELTFNFLHRKFNIQKGSKIIWKGSPTDADVDVTATYLANTPPLDLVQDELPDQTASGQMMYRQKLPFEVNLNMKGELMKPDITFDVVLPENKNYTVGKDIIETVNQRLDQLRKEPSELNKQVFALLLLNRFVSENPFQSSSGMTAESFARTSASKFLTQQLNQLASDLIKGINLNFDVVSEDDYTSGQRQTKTDLNVALSKQLLNDRLTITVGSNFELEGTQNTNRQSSNLAGNVAADYKLSKDGRYMFRAYRKNDYQGILEGYIIETGVGFIVTLDYNKFKEIFLSQKQRERRREQRRQEREAASKNNTNQNPPAVNKGQ